MEWMKLSTEAVVYFVYIYSLLRYVQIKLQ